MPARVGQALSLLPRRGLGALRAVPPIARGAALRLRGVPHDRLRVFYGYPRLPSLTERTLGGIVKFQRMQQQFPNSPWRFNLLYLVSSRLPHASVVLARLSRSAGARFVLNQNGVAYPAWCGRGWEQLNAPMARLLHAADHVFYQSEFCRVSADRFLGRRRGPSEILHNAVDTTVFTPPVAPPPHTPLTLLVGGSQDFLYRVSTALRVLALVARERPDVRMLVTGRLRWTPDEAECTRVARRLVDELGVNERVTFLGPYAQVEAPDIFRRAHLLVHTKYNDPCPATVVEALACGLPVVYSASGGVPELVGPNAGIGIPADLSWERDIPPDPGEMARAVLEIAARRNAYSEAARQRAVERFGLEPWLARHREVFEGLFR